MLVYRRVLGFESNEPPVDWRGRPEKKNLVEKKIPSDLLLMEQKSQTTTWDGRNPVNYGINYQPHLVIVGFLKHQHPIIGVPQVPRSPCPGSRTGKPWRHFMVFRHFWQAVDWAAKGQDAGIFQWRKKRYKQLIQAVTYLDSRSLEVTFPIFEFGSLNNPQKVKRIASNNELVQYLLLVACYPIIGYSDPCWFWTLEIRGLKIWPTQTMHTGWVEIPQNYHTFMCVCVCVCYLPKRTMANLNDHSLISS